MTYNIVMRRYLTVLILTFSLVACGNQNQNNSIETNPQNSLERQCNLILKIHKDSEITKDGQWTFDEAGKLDQQLLEKELVFEDPIIRNQIKEYNQADPFSRDAGVLIMQIAQYCDSKLNLE